MPPKTRKFKNGTYNFSSAHKSKSAAKKEATSQRGKGMLAGIVRYTTKKKGTEWYVYTRKKAARKAAKKKPAKKRKAAKKKKK